MSSLQVSKAMIAVTQSGEHLGRIVYIGSIDPVPAKGIIDESYLLIKERLFDTRRTLAMPAETLLRKGLLRNVEFVFIDVPTILEAIDFAQFAVKSESMSPFTIRVKDKSGSLWTLAGSATGPVEGFEKRYVLMSNTDGSVVCVGYREIFTGNVERSEYIPAQDTNDAAE